MPAIVVEPRRLRGNLSVDDSNHDARSANRDTQQAKGWTMARLFYLVSFLIMAPTFALSQAFGINMGQSISSLDIIEEPGTGVYQVNVPLPHNEFDSYLVVATENFGACKVSGIGKSHGNDRYGTSVRSSFRKLSEALENKYGKPTEDFDFLRPDALWDDSDEWVMAILQNERFLNKFWTNLNGDVKGIGLGVSALGSSSSYVSLGYQFSNFDDCVEEINSSGNKGL